VSSPMHTRLPKAERRRAPAHVLLVDTSQDSLEMYTEWCRHVGLVAISATDPIVGFALARRHHPKVVVADVRICRGFDGLELFQRLRVDPATAEIPGLILTGFISAAARELALLTGCQAFLLKPCAPETLVEEIVRALRSGRVPSSAGTAPAPPVPPRTRRYA
jgi:two-component system cell cycle response regulator DivK